MISLSNSDQTLLKEDKEITHSFEEEVTGPTRKPGSKLELLPKAYLEIRGVGKIGVFSDGMRKVIDRTKRLSEDPLVPVLIQGETGTGKEIVARLVHYGNGNADAPFVSINCSAISPNLFESEIFGYEGGAFTGSKKYGMMGKLELARKGTLVLDEIGDMPLDLQPKLLRVLEEREFYRVGGLKKVELNIRIICTTNQQLVQRVKEGTFRRDLFYRLCVAVIQIPPLRERQGAIEPLAQMFLEQYARQKRRGFRSFQKEAVKVLKNYSWPGNVRELKNMIQRVVLWHDDTEVGTEHLEFLSLEPANEFYPQETQFNPNLFSLHSGGFDLKEVESKIVLSAFSMFNGNQSRTAEYLGISRMALHRKLKKFNNTLKNNGSDSMRLKNF